MERLQEELINYLATKLNIEQKDAAKHIEQCILNTCAEYNMGYMAVYNIFFSYYGLANCLKGICSKKTLQECQDSCNCVIFKNACAPRFISEALIINSDPDKWIEKGITTNELENFVEYASYLYYNYEGGGLSDNAFDALEYHLNKRYKAQGRRYEKIGAEPVERIKAPLPYPMGSLDKIKPDNPLTLKILQSTSPIVWSQKLDGVSGLVLFNKGAVKSIFTRGNGEIGGDITFVKDYIQFPNCQMYSFLAIRGEFVMKKRTFEEKYKDTYSNPRSMVSAKINSGHISIELNDIDFVAYEIIDWNKPDKPTPSQTFKLLKAAGFNIPSNGILVKPLLFDVVELYISERTTSEYPIDGLVIEPESREYPKKAFKMILEEQIRNTRVTNVDWNITRYGKFFPVAVYESVYINGSRLHRASAHNAQHIIDWSMGKGTQIKIVKSGDVIPQIKDVIVDKAIKPILPDTQYSWHWESKDIVLNDIENNPRVQLVRILYFFNTIKVAQLGEKRLEKMFESGYNTIVKITSASEKDFKKIKGFGEKLSKNIFTNIHEALSSTTFDRLFIAFTIQTKMRIGYTILKKVVREWPEILNSTTEEITLKLNKHKISGIGVKRIEMLAQSIPEFKREIMKLAPNDIKNALDKQILKINNYKINGYNNKIKNGAFVLTGFLLTPNYDLEDYIWDNWGDITSTVTSTTRAVICASVTNITEKMTKAHELHIPVYTIQEFCTEYNVPLFKNQEQDLDPNALVQAVEPVSEN